MSVEFTFCPACGGTSVRYAEKKHWVCPQCGFDLYHNVAAAAALILAVDGKVLTVIREREPARGMLALPGGFIDSGESAEEAARRECAEETGFVPSEVRYLCSFPNIYTYKNVPYNTCDFFFTGSAGGLQTLKAEKGEVSGFRLLAPEEIEQAPIAFDSVRRALLYWRENCHM